MIPNTEIARTIETALKAKGIRATVFIVIADADNSPSASAEQIAGKTRFAKMQAIAKHCRSLRVFVKNAFEHLQAMRRNGAEWSDIATVASACGFEAPEDTIRRYFDQQTKGEK